MIAITDLSLSTIYLKDNKNFPWIILLPRIPNITELFQLTHDNQKTLINEISCVSKCMHAYFKPDKINVGALGNIMPQLHIHVVARFKNDMLWPHSVWQESLIETPYDPVQREKLINELSTLLSCW